MHGSSNCCNEGALLHNVKRYLSASLFMSTQPYVLTSTPGVSMQQHYADDLQCVNDMTRNVLKCIKVADASITGMDFHLNIDAILKPKN